MDASIAVRSVIKDRRGKLMSKTKGGAGSLE